MSYTRSNITKKNLLFPIQLGDENNDGKYVNNLLQKTKSLVLSDQNYNKFMKKYLIMTQQSSFKLPEIPNYPILKNEYLIPISRQTYSSGSQLFSKNKLEKGDNKISNNNEKEDNSRLKSAGFTSFKLNKNSKDFLPKVTDSNLSGIPLLPINNQSIINDNHLHIDYHFNSKKYDIENNTSNTIEINNNNNLNNINNNSILNEKNRSIKNKKLLSENEMKIKSIIRSQSSSTNKLFEKKFTLKSTSDIDVTKDFYNKNVYVNSDYKTLFLDLLIDFEFNNRIFNYEEMIKNKYLIKNTTIDEIKKTKILERLKILINNIISGKNENLTSELIKTYEVQDDKVIELKISSLELEFIPINPNYKSSNKDGFNNYFNCESNKDFVFDSNNNYSLNNYEDAKMQRIKIPFSLLPVLYYCKIESFYTILANIITVSENFYKSKKDTDKYSIKEIKEHPQEGLFSEKDNQLRNEEEQIRIDFETVRKVLDSHKDIIFENENYDKDFYSVKNIEWISHYKRYKIKLHPPKIEFYLADKSFNVSKNVPKEMLMFLISKSFINWDFFVLNFLSTFKIFRDNLNERFYKKIKQPKSNKLRFTQENFNSEKFLKLNDFSNQPLSICLDEKFNEPDFNNLSSINFFFTNAHGATNYFIFKSYELNIYLKMQEIIKTVKDQYIEEKLNIETKNCDFKFTMNQLIKLQKLKKFYDIKDYIKRMVSIKKENSNKNGYTKIIKLKNENLQTIKVDFDLKYFENLDDNYFKFLTKSNSVKIQNNEEDYISTTNNQDNEENSINFELRYYKLIINLINF